MLSSTKLVLVGFPNTGKTTLFNHLTGTRYKIGNWSGVTVGKNTVTLKVADKKYELADLPGILSVYDVVDKADSLITREAIDQADVLVHVMDGRYIHRDVVMSLQLLCYEKPQITVISHIDEMRVPWERVKKMIPTICASASDLTLKELVDFTKRAEVVDIRSIMEWPIGFSINNSSTTLAKDLSHMLFNEKDKDVDVQIAEGFYQTAAVIMDRFGCRDSTVLEESWIDHYVLHPVWGVIGFLFLMYLMFAVTIGIGGAFGDFFASLVMYVLGYMPMHHVWQVLIYSLGVGVATCIGFLPILGIMYVFIAYLEQSGYLARAALLADGLMRPLGLSGHSFIPLLLGFGCNVPAVMATRVVSGKNNRLLTALMVPFMSCSARLAIFAIFAAAFFPTTGALVIMGLYLLSFFLGVLTVFLLHYVFRFEQGAPLSLELPEYRMPQIKQIFESTYLKLKGFVKSNLGLIVKFSAAVGFFGSINVAGHVVEPAESILAMVAKQLVGYFAFMGIGANNWQAVVALFSGVVAKEVVLATLNSLYQVGIASQETLLGIFGELGERLLYFPLQALLLDQGNAHLYQIYQYHFSTSAAFAYMVFILLYFPCLSTMIALKNEFGLRWASFSFIWSSFLAVWCAKIAHSGLGRIDAVLLISLLGIIRLFRYFYDTAASKAIFATKETSICS